jgi:Domain of unknown function (DUF4440)
LSNSKRLGFLLSLALLAGAGTEEQIVNPEATAAIRKLEAEIEAAVTSGDTEFLKKVLADDFHFVHGTGIVDNKESCLDEAYISRVAAAGAISR